MTDSSALLRVVQHVQPDEIYNLAAQSHVQVSFETPEYTANADALGPLRILEAMRILKLAPTRGSAYNVAEYQPGRPESGNVL